MGSSLIGRTQDFESCNKGSTPFFPAISVSVFIEYYYKNTLTDLKKLSKRDNLRNKRGGKI